MYALCAISCIVHICVFRQDLLLLPLWGVSCLYLFDDGSSRNLKVTSTYELTPFLFGVKFGCGMGADFGPVMLLVRFVYGLICAFFSACAERNVKENAL